MHRRGTMCPDRGAPVTSSRRSTRGGLEDQARPGKDRLRGRRQALALRRDGTSLVARCGARVGRLRLHLPRGRLSPSDDARQRHRPPVSDPGRADGHQDRRRCGDGRRRRDTDERTDRPPRLGLPALQRPIKGSKVREESIAATEQRRNRCVDEVPAPSVITFNTAVGCTRSHRLARAAEQLKLRIRCSRPGSELFRH